MIPVHCMSLLQRCTFPRKRSFVWVRKFPYFPSDEHEAAILCRPLHLSSEVSPIQFNGGCQFKRVAAQTRWDFPHKHAQSVEVSWWHLPPMTTDSYLIQ